MTPLRSTRPALLALAAAVAAFSLAATGLIAAQAHLLCGGHF